MFSASVQLPIQGANCFSLGMSFSPKAFAPARTPFRRRSTSGALALLMRVDWWRSVFFRQKDPPPHLTISSSTLPFDTFSNRTFLPESSRGNS